MHELVFLISRIHHVLRYSSTGVMTNASLGKRISYTVVGGIKAYIYNLNMH